MAEFRSKNGKKISIHNDGHIFVDGKSTKLKQWRSSSTKYSNLSGQEQKDIKGLGIEDALWKRGLLGSNYGTGIVYISSFFTFKIFYLY